MATILKPSNCLQNKVVFESKLAFWADKTKSFRELNTIIKSIQSDYRSENYIAMMQTILVNLDKFIMGNSVMLFDMTKQEALNVSNFLKSASAEASLKMAKKLVDAQVIVEEVAKQAILDEIKKQQISEQDTSSTAISEKIKREYFEIFSNITQYYGIKTQDEIRSNEHIARAFVIDMNSAVEKYIPIIKTFSSYERTNILKTNIILLDNYLALRGILGVEDFNNWIDNFNKRGYGLNPNLYNTLNEITYPETQSTPTQQKIQNIQNAIDATKQQIAEIEKPAILEETPQPKTATAKKPKSKEAQIEVLKNKKITRTTFKSFVAANADDLWYCQTSSFSGMSDMVEETNETRFVKVAADFLLNDYKLSLSNFRFFEDEFMFGFEAWSNALGNGYVTTSKNNPNFNQHVYEEYGKTYFEIKNIIDNKPNYYVDELDEETDGYSGFGVIDEKTGFVKASFSSKSEAEKYVQKLNPNYVENSFDDEIEIEDEPIITESLQITTSMPEIQNFTNCTMYSVGAFGASKIDCKTLTLQIKKFAQYNNAVQISYIEVGKRKEMSRILTSNPFLVVLQGLNHPDPEDGFVKGESGVAGLMVSSSKYGSFDPRYKTDFVAQITEYCNEKNIEPLVYIDGVLPTIKNIPNNQSETDIISIKNSSNDWDKKVIGHFNSETNNENDWDKGMGHFND